MARSICVSEKSEYAVVMQGKCPLGVISSRNMSYFVCHNLVRSIFEDTKEVEHLIVAVLRDNKMLLPSDHLSEAAQVMCDYHLHAVAIANHQHELVGIITQDHLLEHILDS
ncbi:MAG: CBS domain-containing protein [Pirellulales bacterium]